MRLFNPCMALTLAELTASGASGTFSFAAPPMSPTGAVGTKVVSNGSFAVTFSAATPYQ